jgi:hypothetical protein
MQEERYRNNEGEKRKYCRVKEKLSEMETGSIPSSCPKKPRSFSSVFSYGVSFKPVNTRLYFIDLHFKSNNDSFIFSLSFLNFLISVSISDNFSLTRQYFLFSPSLFRYRSSCQRLKTFRRKGYPIHRPIVACLISHRDLAYVLEMRITEGETVWN